MKSLKLSLLLGIALAAINLPAVAGPGQQVFSPLNSTDQISALKPGSAVAHECPKCGAITVSKVGKDKSKAGSFTCPECKMTIAYRDSGSGKAPKAGFIECEDVKTGKRMTARVRAAQ